MTAGALAQTSGPGPSPLSPEVVTAATVPGGAQGNDNLTPISQIENQPDAYVWGPQGQVYATSGPPTDAILGANYSPQLTDSPDAYDPNSGLFYTRNINPLTNTDQWTAINAPPPIINGGM